MSLIIFRNMANEELFLSAALTMLLIFKFVGHVRSFSWSISSWIHVCHQQSLVIVLLAPAMSLLSFTTQSYIFTEMLQDLHVGNWRYSFSDYRSLLPFTQGPSAGNVPEGFRDRLYVWKGLKEYIIILKIWLILNFQVFLCIYWNRISVAFYIKTIT